MVTVVSGLLLGVGDKLTSEYFSDLIGKTTIRTQSSSVSKNAKGGSDSKSDSYTGRNLLTLDELTRLPRDEAVLLVSGGYSILLKKTFQFEFFKGILNNDNKTSRFDYFDLAVVNSVSNNLIDNREQNVEETVLTLEDLIEGEKQHDEVEFFGTKDNPEQDIDIEELVSSIISTEKMIENYDYKADDILVLPFNTEDEENLVLPLDTEDEEDLVLSLDVDEEEELILSDNQSTERESLYWGR